LLAKNYKIIAVELQGHGHTNDRNSPESFEQDADDVVGLLHNLNIAKASLFGFSNGGNTAMQISFKHSEIVNKLILASTFYKREGFPQGFFDGMKNATIKDMPESLKSAFLKIKPDSNLLMSMFNKDRERMIDFIDWKDETISTIRAPTLIISGDHDVINLEHTVAMAKLIPKSSLMILPGSHGAYMGVAESPDSSGKILEMTIGVIEDFLNK
ncbi:MAG TPA: alpha/beta hydrolase, partial [Saprospiraceae bacterium]|nr:alpha/beta hydrolase [Saprospiraceae bacterium]